MTKQTCDGDMRFGGHKLCLVGKGLCCAGTEDTATGVAGAEAAAELHLQLVRRARAWAEVGAGVTALAGTQGGQSGGGPVRTAWLHSTPHPPRPAAPGCSYFHLSERLNSCKERWHETDLSFGVFLF